ncbi:hypothetical protein NFX46_15795 [Streptomyces phaeoluteigriseus]|uniref:Uncharacterized protein n=1 Tax=Streptomyces phaeoluteigriseus TaxID=114686 RepID=A0ABY4Z809_9ACTN|nr:hypothetical protein [Streptomyces phaeoluteigriseus]USQ85121.1 hypothetical protein NFX46_15795 [Streptomyces phaeoluteigriseus]
MSADAREEHLRDFLADPVNSTLELSAAVARCAKALGLAHAVVHLADRPGASATTPRSFCSSGSRRSTPDPPVSRPCPAGHPELPAGPNSPAPADGCGPARP